MAPTFLFSISVTLLFGLISVLWHLFSHTPSAADPTRHILSVTSFVTSGQPFYILPGILPCSNLLNLRMTTVAMASQPRLSCTLYFATHFAFYIYARFFARCRSSQHGSQASSQLAQTGGEGLWPRFDESQRNKNREKSLQTAQRT